jgi:hypothetical protein
MLTLDIFYNAIDQSAATQVLQISVAPMFSFVLRRPVGLVPETMCQSVQVFLTDLHSHAVNVTQELKSFFRDYVLLICFLEIALEIYLLPKTQCLLARVSHAASTWG